jgi:site-specific recombinase XerD
MLCRCSSRFLEYCRLADFLNRSIQALEIHLGELTSFACTRKPKSTGIKYLHLAPFTPEFNNPSIHMRPSRVWPLRRFCHFLSLHAQNITKKLPYPKIEKTLPHFLAQDEYNRLISHFSSRITDLRGHAKSGHHLAAGQPRAEDLHLFRHRNHRCVKKELCLTPQ